MSLWTHHQISYWRVLRVLLWHGSNDDGPFPAGLPNPPESMSRDMASINISLDPYGVYSTEQTLSGPLKLLSERSVEKKKEDI